MTEVSHCSPSILLTRALPVIRSKRRSQQAGFIPNRSTIDHKSALRLIEKAKEFRKDRHLYIASIDLKAALDSVDHTSLWRTLKTLGAPPIIVTLPSIICLQIPDISFGDYTLTDLEYANDTFFCKTVDNMRDALTIFDAEAKNLGLSINWTKTELMQVENDPDPTPQVCNISLKFVDSDITKTDDPKSEINRRRALATSIIQSLRRPLWKHHHISRHVELRIYNASILCVLLYGSKA
ncbi:uncharacterized protein [Penaeus vannamei]|uniref:uncharacterized protein n=1 Tax=Penaeus vannamei TaxID=6689 RepID=UPI00387F52AE